jgi:8-oxo-dGTP diphosphatase
MEIRKVSAGVVIKDGQILMMKRKCEPYKGKWCIPGGFTNKSINESVENCCIREIKEETGIEKGKR